jgi:large subunit ribosomal protein L21
MTDETKDTSTTDESVAEDAVTSEELVAEATAAEESEPEAEVAAEAEPAEEAETEEAIAPAAAKAPRTKARNAHVRTPVKDTPGTYAVIETGGKQYRVKVGDRLTIEKLDQESGADVSFDRVLMLGGDGSTRIGTPVVEGATVTATINQHGRGEKIVVFKYKAKKRYRRRTGHRQSQTYITITGITG